MSRVKLEAKEFQTLLVQVAAPMYDELVLRDKGYKGQEFLRTLAKTSLELATILLSEAGFEEKNDS